MKNQQAELEWREGETPVSRKFDDPYFSLNDGLAETTHVFLDGNELPARFCDGFQIAELGFGTGLNLLAALLAWRKSGQAGRFRFTSFEAFPMAADDMERALAAFPEALNVAGPMLEQIAAGNYQFETEELIADIIIGDARTTLKDWNGAADAWFLDGFSPAKNPELWEPVLMAEVAQHTAPNGTFATYTAAGFVRKSLAESGFAVERVKGFGRKRHMTIGKLESKT
ncbi:tRNA (5-methylaminomethyl-2-thiouridine)(34)-methyltransferase MnmD [Halocynthiibacter sp. C4]|uniref:tRNA (5-methylaminomethyl-2-thiouridine)(34)-methyltransferase MnmD n=1 Tax=Halocynthiibacter sp. C4 TaxID=2992758 RepID=UPI00237A8BEF|nr:tRNA (5-methylaminomethyl-2-thiouridine)(34)-methyltransferase MnmD [Halocynthiibacter sp. C4]MDE0590757.1 tRNA (5-methylaminomethyl-2-thiouridine)(34)-methyltransferase MnmD [Halocynthiibacter sp. C4]